MKAGKTVQMYAVFKNLICNIVFLYERKVLFGRDWCWELKEEQFCRLIVIKYGNRFLRMKYEDIDCNVLLQLLFEWYSFDRTVARSPHVSVKYAATETLAALQSLWW